MGGEEYDGPRRFSSMPEVREWRVTPTFRLRERWCSNSLQGVGVLELRMRIQHPDRQWGDHSRTHHRTELQVVTLTSVRLADQGLGKGDFPFKELEGLASTHQII